jgi:hypothetical protein
MVGRRSGGQEIHRQQRERHRRAPLHEENVVVPGDAEELAQERDRLVVHRLVFFAPVRVLHHGNAGAGKVEHLGLGALQCRQR